MRHSSGPDSQLTTIRGFLTGHRDGQADARAGYPRGKPKRSRSATIGGIEGTWMATPPAITSPWSRKQRDSDSK